MSTLWDFMIRPFADGQAAFDLAECTAFVMMCLFLGALMGRSPLLRTHLQGTWARKLLELCKHFRVTERAGRVLTVALVLGALFVSASYFSRSALGGHYLHRWDAFHTVLGAKYHNELGYFDLYKCSLAIDKTGERHFRSVKKVRDLRTRKHVPVREHLKDNDCLERFTPERLAEFRTDLNTMGASMHGGVWKRLFTDKGFNGTPFYTVVVAALMKVSGTSIEQLTTLSFLDVGLMLLAFASVGWAFGVRRAAIFALFFCTFFPNRFIHMGGSILRFDYVAALTIALCAIKKDRWGVAGVLMAWATMVRIFPVLFAGGILLKIAVEVLATRHWERRYTYFTAAFAASLVLFFVTSLVGLEGGGADWLGWWQDMATHNSKSASFRIGFRHLFMLGGSLEHVNYGAMQKAFLHRQVAYLITVALLLAPLLLSIRRMSAATFASLFGAVAFFLLVISTRYYYSVFALVFLVDRDILRDRTLLVLGALLFGASALDFFYFETYENTALMYNFIVGVQLTAFVAVLSLSLLFAPEKNEPSARSV